MDSHNLLGDLLREPKIPHTRDFPRRSFDSMPFKSWFGLTSLLREYGVGSAGYELGSLRDMEQLPVPFLAATKDGAEMVHPVCQRPGHFVGVVFLLPWRWLSARNVPRPHRAVRSGGGIYGSIAGSQPRITSD